MSDRKLMFEDLGMLAEDNAMYYDKWNASMKGHAAGPQVMSLMDLLKQYSLNNQHPNHSKAPTTPLYGSEMMVELLGDLVIQAAHCKQALEQVKASPILKDRPDSISQVEHIIKKTIIIKNLVDSISADIDKFSVEKPSSGE